MSKRINQEPTNKEIYGLVQDTLEAINGYATQNDQRLDRIESEMVTKDYLEKELSKMVTKDYLDEKLMDLRGDLVVIMRKGDVKLAKLVNILNRRKVISKKDVDAVLSLEPFPKFST